MPAVQRACGIMASMMALGQPPLHPSHNGILIAAHSSYDNTMVDATDRWMDLVEKYRAWPWFRMALDHLATNAMLDPEELVNLDPDLL